MLNNFKTTLYVGITAILLSACGGGGDGSAENDSGYTLLTPKPDQAYTGSRDPSLLDESSAAIFASLVVGDSTSSDSLQSRGAANNTLLLDQPAMLTSLSNTILNKQQNSQLLGRSVSQTISCDYGGTASVAGDLNDEEETGVLVYTYQNCQLEEGITLNGKTSTTIHSSFAPESSTVAFDSLETTSNGETYTLIGTIKNTESYSQESSQNITTETEVINLTTVHSASQFKTYFQNYTSTKATNFGDLTEQSLSGRVFLSNLGYVTVSTSANYITDNNSQSEIPEQGTILLTGASQSQSRISGAVDGSQDNYQLNLDKDGDNVYELTSVQNSSTSPETDNWGDNQAPIAIISAGEVIWSDGTHTDETEYEIGTELTLSSENSYDPDDIELSYVWTVEEKPNESTATIEQHEFGPEFLTFTPDIKGEYKISLKVTDDFGSQQNSIDFITMKVVNIAPRLDISLQHYSVNIEVGIPVEVTAHAVDADALVSYEVNGDITINYIWLERPEGSGSDLTLNDSYYLNNADVNEVLYGQGKSHHYSVIPDQPGNYKAQFTATDSDGATTVSLLEFYIPGDTLDDNDITTNVVLNDSDISCYYSYNPDVCDWSTKTVLYNEPMNLSLHTDSIGVSQCSWQITSENTDTTGVVADFYSVGSSIDFTPTILGNYLVETRCQLPNETFISTTMTVVE